MAKQRFQGKLYKVPKTALFTKEVKVSQKGVSISKAHISGINPITGELYVDIKINGVLHRQKSIQMAENLRKEALRTATNINKKVTKGEITKYQAKQQIKTKLSTDGGVYGMAKRNIFIDNLLKKSGVNMTDSLTKYLKGRPDLINKLKSVTTGLKGMSKNDFESFYAMFSDSIKDFTDFYRRIQASGDVTQYEEMLEYNLDTLLDNIREFKSLKRR